MVQLMGQYRTKAARGGPCPLKCVVSKKKKVCGFKPEDPMAQEDRKPKSRGSGRLG